MTFYQYLPHQLSSPDIVSTWLSPVTKTGGPRGCLRFGDAHLKGEKGVRGTKNYTEFSTWDSHMVTHCSTNQAIRCLFTAERTGCETFIVLWPNTSLQIMSGYLSCQIGLSTMKLRYIWSSDIINECSGIVSNEVITFLYQPLFIV